jgi:hypothetical protein
MAYQQLRRGHYEYRTAVRVPAPDVVALFKTLKIYPDATSKETP